jgi:hypothetical protein
MVHALSEARRVLEPGGILVDLRPAARHRRVGVIRNGRTLWLARMRERFDDDRAADRAVARLVGRGQLRAAGRFEFSCRRVMDTLADLKRFLDDMRLPPHDWLVERVARALERGRARRRIVVENPLVLRVLRKASPLP